MDKDFPISDYYRDNIEDAISISRSGGWWTAALLIRDPKSNQPFVGCYRWQHTESGWKIRGRLKINSKKDLEKMIEILSQFNQHFN
jgi:hypothetical protein|tara:strand:+ start:3782 stop:4039 length:258 start_codon:yes stop_codon:yes gene_type:complete